MLVRRAAPQDREHWLRMRMLLWPGDSPPAHLAEMEDMITDPLCAVFVAETPQGRLVGFLEAAQRKYADGCDTSPVGYIEGWYVEPDVRRAGVGKLLVMAAEDWARQSGLREMASDCLIDNQISYNAHISLEYQEVERLIHFRKSL
jgi:aminoglycoside 6'-N-acetyltransferase I